MRQTNNMSLKKQNKSIPHQKHIFLDVYGAIDTFFSAYNISEDEFKHASFEGDIQLEDHAGKQLVEYLINNKNYLEGFIEIDDETGEIAKLFPDNCIPVDAMEYLNENYYPNTLELICE